MTFDPAPRGGLKLSREMRLLLVLLLILALIAGVYVWNANRSAAALAQTPPPSDTVRDAATTVGSSGTVTPPDGQVEVPSIPAFGPAESSTTDVPPTPGGINPDTPLAALPTVNPFRPLALDAKDEAPAPAATEARSPAPQPPVTVPRVSLNLPRTEPASPVTRTPRTEQAESLPLSPIPSAPERVTVKNPSVEGNPFPPPTEGPSPSADTVTLRPPQPLPASPPPTSPTENSSAKTAPPPAPVRPPVVALSVPREPGKLSSATTSAALPPATALPAPAAPKPITQLAEEGPAAALSELDRWVQSRGLTLSTAVLGPVNTAILHSKDGFLVVSAGQTLPDSDVTVRDVSEDSVTLTRGNDTTILELQDQQGEP